MTRRALLSTVGLRLPDDLGRAGRVAVDDLLDAAAVAWSAGRIATGQASCLPDPPQAGPPQAGPDGRAIAIWL
jgi:predicted RNase H-like nuclease